MARPTPTLEAILAGLSRGGQPGLATLVRAELERMTPRDTGADDYQPTGEEEEDRRQAVRADELVTRLVKREILAREGLLELMRELRVDSVETVLERVPDGSPETIDVLSDGRRIEALRRFLDAWHTEIGPLREGRLKW